MLFEYGGDLMEGKYTEFLELLFTISNSKSKKSFKELSSNINTYIESLNREDFLSIVKEIKTIPEKIEPSSTQEKLYSKASDIVLARCFFELGLKAKAIDQRGNSADIICESDHGYTLVADSKTFRLSRTAKNQKDFKISTLSKWRGKENDYAVLVAPYFQYPSVSSQVYSSSLTEEVCLFSWEHILFLLNNNVKENASLNLEPIWNAPKRIIRDSKISFADSMNNLFPYINKMVCDRVASLSIDLLNNELMQNKKSIINRSITEISYINNRINIIKNYSRQKAINELLKSEKLSQRVKSIQAYIRALGEGSQ
jgi:hypothetical protein